jgi:hypothetical protein
MSTAETAPSAAEAGPLHSLQTKPLMGLLMALLAGVAAWAVLQATLPVFRIPEEMTELPTPVPVDKMLEVDEATHRPDRTGAHGPGPPPTDGWLMESGPLGPTARANGGC